MEWRCWRPSLLCAIVIGYDNNLVSEKETQLASRTNEKNVDGTTRGPKEGEVAVVDS